MKQKIIDDEELTRYSKNWHKPAVSKDLAKYDNMKDSGDTKVEVLFQPRGAQIEALYALEDSRAGGATKRLVQAATGERDIFMTGERNLEFTSGSAA